MLAVYTFVGPVLAHVTLPPACTLPASLSLFGVGTTVGNLVAARFAGCAVMTTIAALLLWSGLSKGLYALSAGRLPDAFVLQHRRSVGTALAILGLATWMVTLSFDRQISGFSARLAH